MNCETKMQMGVIMEAVEEWEKSQKEEKQRRLQAKMKDPVENKKKGGAVNLEGEMKKQWGVYGKIQKE